MKFPNVRQRLIVIFWAYTFGLYFTSFIRLDETTFGPHRGRNEVGRVVEWANRSKLRDPMVVTLDKWVHLNVLPFTERLKMCRKILVSTPMVGRENLDRKKKFLQCYYWSYSYMENWREVGHGTDVWKTGNPTFGPQTTWGFIGYR